MVEDPADLKTIEINALAALAWINDARRDGMVVSPLTGADRLEAAGTLIERVLAEVAPEELGFESAG